MKLQNVLVVLCGLFHSSQGQSCDPYWGDKTGYASTTHYYDGHEGACGCGIDDQLYDWQENAGDQLFTAAGSQNLFGDGTWCGSGCGQCYELTNTGMIADYGQGDCSGAGQTITVMITNLCPADSNQQWCSMPDAYGYPVHFDIMAQGSPQGWNNPIVTYQQVPCPGQLASDYGSCYCNSQSRVRRHTLGGPSKTLLQST